MSCYNYLTNVHVISKQQAIDLAAHYCRCASQQSENYTFEADLLQAHPSNRISLVIDPETMTLDPNRQVVPLRPFDVKENQMFWQVTIKQHLSQSKFKSWIYEIDATSGNLIQSFGIG